MSFDKKASYDKTPLLSEVPYDGGEAAPLLSTNGEPERDKSQLQS